jgi:hypothetical protein
MLVVCPCMLRKHSWHTETYRSIPCRKHKQHAAVVPLADHSRRGATGVNAMAKQGKVTLCINARYQESASPGAAFT